MNDAPFLAGHSTINELIKTAGAETVSLAFNGTITGQTGNGATTFTTSDIVADYYTSYNASGITTKSELPGITVNFTSSNIADGTESALWNAGGTAVTVNLDSSKASYTDEEINR